MDMQSLPVDRTDLELSFMRSRESPAEREVALLFAEEGGSFLDPALQCIRSRWRSGSLTRYDGALRTPEAIRAVREARENAGNLCSPTSLERALACPFSFLVTHVLRLRPTLPQENDYTPLERGSIIHAALEEIYRTLDDDRRLPLRAEHLGRALEVLDQFLGREREGLAALPRVKRVARIATLADVRCDLASLLAREAHLPPEDHSIPVSFELCFGIEQEGAYPPFEWKLPSGRVARLRGRIDRIDSTSEGLLQVIDYKSGKIHFKEGAITGTNDERNVVSLQLAIYAEAARRHLGCQVARAVLRSTARAEAKEAGLTMEDLAHTKGKIEILLERALRCIEEGWFPSIPGKGCCQSEISCACGPAARARYQKKRGDPQLEAHLALLKEDAS
jgi:RecB family exonuclease